MIKLITHEDAVKRLKELEILQRKHKAFRDLNFKQSITKASEHQKALEYNKKEINMLLSIVFWHKLAKKMHFKITQNQDK